MKYTAVRYRVLKKLIQNGNEFPTNYQEDADFVAENAVGNSKQNRNARFLLKDRVKTKGFHIKEDKICTKDNKLVVSEEEMLDIIAQEHESGGHVGETKMIRVISEKYEGIEQKKIIQHVSTCMFCLENKKIRQPVIHNKPIRVYRQWHTCGIDLTTIDDRQGRKFWVLVAIDFYSRSVLN